MALLIPKCGESRLLQYMVGKLEPGNLILRLFVNDIEPDGNTVASDLTECTTPGYESIVLYSDEWVVETSSGVVEIVYGEQVFTFTDGVRLHGLYITDVLGNLIVVETFEAHYETPTGGGKIFITPALRLSSDDGGN